jgi:hypothetical protein
MITARIRPNRPPVPRRIRQFGVACWCGAGDDFSRRYPSLPQTRLDPMNGTGQWMHGGSQVVALEPRAPEKRHPSPKSVDRLAQLCKTSTLEVTLR